MPVGLQVFDADGNVLVDTSDRLARILGIATIATATGSLVNSNFTAGTPFFIAIPLNVSAATFGPDISVSGSTLSWNFNGRTVTSHRIVYGIY